jgi:hypothetical protein
MLLCADTSTVDDYDMPECERWSADLARRGILLDAMGLRPPADARTVRVRGGEVLRTDGPFAETKEQIGGLQLIECADRDEAVRIASTNPWATRGMIEVRQVFG